jgi:NADP-dependent aldehyde dehydrogenase
MSRRTFCTFNPKENTSNTKRYFTHTLEEVDQMILGASKAYTLLARKTNQDICDLLCLIKENLFFLKEDIASMYCKESGLSDGRFESEFNRTLFQLDLFAKHIIKAEYISTLNREQQLNNKHLEKRIMA